MNEESSIYGASMRAWLALILTLTVCLMQGFGMKVEEPLYGLTYIAIGFFFGQKTNGGNNGVNKPNP